MKQIFNVLRRFNDRSFEKGFMSAEWIFATTVLMFPTFLLVLSLVQVPARKNLTQEAANAGARAYVQALDQEQAPTAARQAVYDAIVAEVGDSSGVLTAMSNGDIKVNVTQTDGYCPGREITVSVEMPMPVSWNPFDPGSDLFSMGSLASKSTERIDDYAELADSTTGDSSFDYDEENDRCP